MLDPFLTEPQNIGGEFAAYGRKAFEKVFQGESVREIVEQRADWDTRAFEHGCAIQDFRITGNKGFGGHDFCLTGNVSDKVREGEGATLRPGRDPGRESRALPGNYA
jgi:hypothetical protein